MFDLMQPQGGPLIDCHSRFSTEWNRVCFPSVFWGQVQVLLTHRLRVYIFFPNAVCVSLFRLLCCPGRTVVFCCELCLLIRFGTAVGCFGVVLATIGPITTQELFSLTKLCIACVTACMQWFVFGLCWEQGWGLGLLDKPGFLGNHTDRARGLYFFSTTPE